MKNDAKTRTMTDDTKRRLKPKLRFSEFRDDPGWEEKTLWTIAGPVTEKADGGGEHNFLTLSGEHGIVLQSEYFGKKVAGDNSERYIKIARNDFVYNDRTTTRSVYGTIKRLSTYDSGIVSPIYKCFRFNSGENPAFWEWYFESGTHDLALGRLVNEGARAGRFNISVHKFLTTTAWCPREPEQRQIAECLSSLDALIAAHSRKLDALKTHKKGLMQQLFPREGEFLPRLRFPGLDNPWKEYTLGALSDDISSGKDKSHAEGQFDLYGSTGIIGRTSSGTYTGTYILVARVGANAGFLTKANGTFGVTDNTLVIHLKERDSLHFIVNYLDSLGLNKLTFGSGQPLITGGQLKALPLLIPDNDEQETIAQCLAPLHELITAQTQELDTLKAHKKGLMQQLFPSSNEAQA